MNIYIDESGIFKNPANKDNIASCVAGLCIPSCRRRDIVKEYISLKNKWGIGRDEVKGSQLGEKQISQVALMLKKHDVLLEIVVTDLGLMTDQHITDYKIKSAAGMTINLTPQHPKESIIKAKEWQAAYKSMPNNLFVQAAMMNEMVPALVQKLLLYYSRRLPKELGKFNWVVDAKDKKLTSAEKVWSEAIYTYIYSHSLGQPLFTVEGGDYSHFEKHKVSKKREAEIAKDNPELDGEGLSALPIKKILGGGFDFQDSKVNYGLQLADILVNAVQRAFNRKLQQEGWEELGSLLISYKPHAIHFISFALSTERQPPTIIKSPFYHVMNVFDKKAKSLWIEKDRQP
jgi:hypothetical protein